MSELLNFFYKSFYILFTLKDKSYGVIPFIEEKEKRFYLVVYSFHNRWVFAKGHRLIGEDEISAAKRELKEETGISDCHLIPNFSIDQHYKFKLLKLLPVNKTVKLFAGKVKNQMVRLDQKELLDYKWVSLKDDLTFLSRDGQQILRKVDQKLNGQ